MTPQGNGYISTGTLKELLHEIAPDLSDRELEAAVEEIDEDGSGKIEFEGTWIQLVIRWLTEIYQFQSSGNWWPAKKTE